MAEATLKVQGTNFFLHPLPSALKRLVKSVVAEKNNNLQKPHARSQYLKLAHVASEAPEPPKPKVAIVGAGIAGLYSAYILQELGVEYTIYEASNRIGGRIKTHYFETQSGQAANAHPDGVATSAAAKNKIPSEVVPGKEDADNHSDKPDTDMKDSVAHKTRARSSSKAKLEEPQETKKVKHDDGKVDTIAAPVEVHGAQPAVSETYAELGAMRLPDVENHWRVFDLINRVGLTSSVIPFKMAADQKNSFVYINKTALRKNDPRSSDVADLQFPKNIADLWKGYHSLQKEDGSKLSADDIVDKIIQPFIEELSAGDPTSDDIQSKKLLANDFHSLESYLREKLKSDFFIPAEKLEPFGLLSFLDIMACSTGLFELSLSEFVIDAWQFSGASNWSTIKGGMSRMVNNLGSKLTNQNVHLGCKVTKVNVDKSTNKSQLTYIENGTLKTTAFYDHVIVTVPLPVLRHIQFVSPSTKDVLGYEKREAIRDFGYDHSCKIFLRFNTRWWEKAPFNIVGGSSTTDLPNRVIVYPSYGQDLPDGVLLASYTWGTDAVRWAGLSESDRLHQALENIVEMHTALVTDPALAKTIEQEIRNSFNGGQSICWTNEPQSLGAFSYLYPSQFGRMQEVVNAPVEGIVHFAGEHADIYHAWIAASLNSAYRAVKQVVAKNTKLGDLLQEKFSKKNLLKTVTTASVAANMEAKNKTAPLMATEAMQHAAVPKKISLQSFSRRKINNNNVEEIIEDESPEEVDTSEPEK